MARLLLALAACVVFLAACGGDDDSSPSATPGSPTATHSSGATDGGSPTSTGNPSSTVPPEGLTYTVQDGDTLGAIAARYGVSVEAIAAANGIDDPASIQVGQVLVVPGGDELDPTQPPVTGGGGQTPSGEVTLLQLVDKRHGLPSGYVPPGLQSVPTAYRAPGFSGSLRAEALPALQAMLDAARAKGHDIRVVSAYRSYSQQEATFQYWVDTLGYDEAVRVSAMAGHSEHQLGTTADVSTAEAGWSLEESFGGTAAGQWLAAHAHEYGFALSYPAGAEAVTGYAYEPWHFRYIGEAEAAAWKASGLTLNKYLGG